MLQYVYFTVQLNYKNNKNTNIKQYYQCDFTVKKKKKNKKNTIFFELSEITTNKKII